MEVQGCSKGMPSNRARAEHPSAALEAHVGPRGSNVLPKLGVLNRSWDINPWQLWETFLDASGDLNKLDTG